MEDKYKKMYKQLFHNPLKAVAFHEMVFNEQGEPVDYIFLEVNQVFKDLTKLNSEKIIGKRITEVIPGIKKQTDFIDIYGEMVAKGSSLEIDKYSKPLDKFYRISAFTVEDNKFITIFSDITEKKRLETDLNQINQEYKTIFENLDISFSLIDVKSKNDLRYQRFSAKLEEEMGLNNREIQDVPIKKLLKGEQGEKAYNMAKKAVELKETVIYEEKIALKAEEKYWLNKFSPVIIDGQVEKIVGSSVDLTDTKQYKKLQAIFDSFDDLYYVITRPTEDKKDAIIKEVSPGIEEVFGYTREEAIGQKISKVYLPDDLNSIVNIHNLIKEGKSFKRKTYFKRKDNSSFPAYINIYPFKSADGEIDVLAVGIDISEIEAAREKLEINQFAIDKAAMMIYRVTPAGVIEYVNQSVVERLGYKESELIGQNVYDLIVEKPKVRQKYWKRLRANGSLSFESKNITKAGDIFPVLITSHYLKVNNNEYEFSFVQDISKRKAQEQELYYMSLHDKLTGLHNRDYIENKILDLNQEKYHPISIIMVDINGLKIINDSYGLDKGDQILRNVAGILKDSIRTSDFLARWGDDEFLIILPETKKSSALKIKDRISLNCNKINERDEVPITLGVGLAEKSIVETDLLESIHYADDQMYKNKLTESHSKKNKLVQNLLNTLSVRSDETKEHAVRMTDLAFKLGYKINLNDDELNNLNLLATLHDIGKVTVPEAILNKPGSLTDEEWEEIKAHPERGYRIAAATEEFTSVAKYILHHHERWDGRGYPGGLVGEEIPLLSRIITIVDSFDVMTNGRPYKEPMSQEEALKEINDCAGTQFDPDLADEFIKIFGK